MVQHNAKLLEFRSLAQVHVRFGKAMRGGPRRRTVLTVFDWAADVVEQYLAETRPCFGADEHPAMFVTERGTRIAGSYTERFAEVRDEASPRRRARSRARTDGMPVEQRVGVVGREAKLALPVTEEPHRPEYQPEPGVGGRSAPASPAAPRGEAFVRVERQDVLGPRSRQSRVASGPTPAFALLPGSSRWRSRRTSGPYERLGYVLDRACRARVVPVGWMRDDGIAAPALLG
jgi:hypothetical protein